MLATLGYDRRDAAVLLKRLDAEDAALAAFRGCL